MTTVNSSTIDGRTARRDRNRTAVLDAVLELFAADHLSPRPEDVAARSGVSLRSVYRYFRDPDELVRAALAHHVERVSPLFELDALGDGTLDERIARFVRHRLRLYEAIAPMARAARAAAPRNPVIRARYDETRRLLRRQLEQHFATELRRLPAARRRNIADVIDTLFQLEALDHLRVELGNSERRVSAALRDSLAALLTY